MYSSPRTTRTTDAVGGRLTSASVQGTCACSRPFAAPAVNGTAATANAKARARQPALFTPLPIGEADLVIADPEEVAFGNRLSRDTLPIVFDAVRRAHVDH